MPKAVKTLLLAVVLSLAAPAFASASASATNKLPVSKLLFVAQGSPMASPQSMSTVPLHFTVSAGQAAAIAERSPTLIALHHRLHPLQVFPVVWLGSDPYWYVMFEYHGKLVGDANVSRTGTLMGAWTGPQAIASYTHGGVPWAVNGWFILVPAALLFMLPFIDPRRLRAITMLDGLAVLSFLASWELIAHANLEPGVWLAYPPLLYLAARLLWIGFGRSRSGGRLAPLLSTRTLLIALPLLLGARILLSLLAHEEIDVGYESVIGAYRLLHHLPIYWNDPNHGDTYGPIAYLAYAPFEMVFPWTNSLSNLRAADTAPIFFDLGTVVALIFLGRRLRSGADGTRLGLVLAWAWAACPFTTIGLVEHTNDALVAMLGVVSVLVISTPVVTGAVVGLAAAAKFSPAGLLPLLAAPRQRGAKGALVCVGAFVAVVVTAILSWLPPGGLHYFWQRTIGYQIHRVDVFSPWALHPGLHPAQTALEALALLLAAAVAFFPKERSLRRTCALAGAVMIAVQLPATHWFYYYIMWFLPFALVALLVGAPKLQPVAEPTVPDEWVVERGAGEPVLAEV
jgi:hypothetical protein